MAEPTAASPPPARTGGGGGGKKILGIDRTYLIVGGAALALGIVYFKMKGGKGGGGKQQPRPQVKGAGGTVTRTYVTPIPNGWWHGWVHDHQQHPPQPTTGGGWRN